MRQTYPHLTGKGLLSAFVACLLSGHSVADVAGRVNFVVGKVQAVAADGTRRNVVRGELVNSGERLETNAGRVQIRFTDGSFVSLQPNTVFGLDNYAFNKAAPNEGSLLFNFIRGSMRTVSGAIGKVNRNNYKVQTPVATIGIRGTSYAASQEPNGRLLLTVGSGIVNLANEFGDSDINVGQTFEVQQGQAPNNAPKGTSVTARANDPESKQEENKDSSGQNDRQKPDLAAGDQTTKDGKSLIEAGIVTKPSMEVFIQTTNGIPRLSNFGSLLNGTSNAKIYQNVIAGYHSLSTDGLQVGNLLSLIGTDFTGGETAGKTIIDARNSTDTLKFRNVRQLGTLSFGEWTNGTASVVNPYLGSVQQLNLSANQFMPYIVGTTAEKTLGNNMMASYSLASPTNSLAKGAGTLTKLNITIDLNLMPLVSVDMAATLANISYSAQLTKAPLLNIDFDKSFSGFILSATGNGLYAQSNDEGTTCNGTRCPVTLSAFLSGTDMGVVYEIFRNQATLISGVAVLSGSESPISSTTNPQSLPSSLAANYSASFSGNVNVFGSGTTKTNVASTSNLAAVFDSNSNGLLSTFHAVEDEGGDTIAKDFYGALNTATVSAAQTKDIGHAAKSLSWGRWTNGRVDVGDDEGGGFILGADTNIHYLIGLPTPASQLPTSGSVSYSLVGGTASAIFGETNATSSDIGQVSSGNLLVDFGNATTQLSLGISGFSQASTLQALNISGSGTLNSASSALSFGDMSVLANQGALQCTSCSASANGQFFGAVSPISTGAQSAPVAAGFTYNVTGTVQATQPTSIDVKGVAGFANPSVFIPNTGG